eukprot:COSAG03_NODE_1536_length_3911_cov_2.531742_5_plen_29_part_01
MHLLGVTIRPAGVPPAPAALELQTGDGPS